MSARRCGISLQVFNSIAHKRAWRDVELNARGEIPCLQATMYYFVYHINTIALWLQEKPTSSMSEHKRIEIVRCVSTKAQDGKMR